ncbi:MAG: hypothetical protein KAH01_04855 [Caldisericia bacterium]|nr:hypothetical protein [Caldisericia bacterium]
MAEELEGKVFIELKIWPDYEWLYTDENWSHKSDDYIVATIESINGEPDEEQIKIIANGGTI